MKLYIKLLNYHENKKFVTNRSLCDYNNVIRL